MKLEMLKRILNEMNFDIIKIHEAQTGTIYFTVNYADTNFTIRFANHSDCYANTDLNVASSKCNIDGVSTKKELIANLTSFQNKAINNYINEIEENERYELSQKNPIKYIGLSEATFYFADLAKEQKKNENLNKSLQVKEVVKANAAKMNELLKELNITSCKFKATKSGIAIKKNRQEFRFADFGKIKEFLVKKY